jgi:hypothetical protein
MGGYGSGRKFSKKLTVEQCQVLDVADFAPTQWSGDGLWRSGTVTWPRRTPHVVNSVEYRLNIAGGSRSWLELSYSLPGTEERTTNRTRMITTIPHFGGYRWWFVCPLSVNQQLCGKRVRKLYFPPGGQYFGCRHCYNLTYTTTQTQRHRVTSF